MKFSCAVNMKVIKGDISAFQDTREDHRDYSLPRKEMEKGMRGGSALSPLLWTCFTCPAATYISRKEREFHCLAEKLPALGMPKPKHSKFKFVHLGVVSPPPNI